MDDNFDEFDLRDAKLWKMHEFFNKHDYKRLTLSEINALPLDKETKGYLIRHFPYVGRCECGCLQYSAVAR